MVKTTKSRQTDRQTEYLSIQNTKALKGIFSCFVLMHHLYQHSGIFHNSKIGYVFQLMGYLSVAVFFFLTGYGLSVSYKEKGRTYIDNFPKKRILPFYVICVLSIILYSVEKLILKENMNITTLIKSFFFGGTIVGNGWYLQASLILYLLYYFSFKVIIKDNLKYIACSLFLIVYCILCNLFNLSTTWYESIVTFILGLTFPLIKNIFDKLTDSTMKKLLVVLIEFLLFAFLILCGGADVPTYATILIKMISAIIFVVLVLSIMKVVNIEHTITKFLGDISMEIYVFQGLFLSLYHSQNIYISNPYVYIILVVFSTIAFSILIHPFCNNIYKFCGNKI